MILRKSGAGIAVALTLVLSMVVGVASTSALTTSELLNLLVQSGALTSSQLSAVQAIVGGTTAAATTGYVFNTNLTIGSRGADVTALQNMLGISPATGYFGSITKAAVIQYQIAKGITPAAGYVGAITRAALNAGGSVVIPGTPVPTGTDLRVTLSATSPMSGTIVAGQAAANLAEFTFTNTSASPAVVTNVTLARTGVSADTTLTNVYLFDGVTRLTDSATVSSGKITFNSGAGLFTVPSGSSRTISVKSDIAASISGQLVGVALTGITSNVAVSASYPISGANMNVFSATLAGVVVGTPTNTGATIQAGTLNTTVWSASLGLSTRAVNLRSAAFKVIGSAPSDALQNWKLFVSGVQVASATGIDANGYVTFNLSSAPYKIDSTRTLEVRADVVKGSSRTFQVSLQNVADLQVVDTDYNVSVSATGIPANGTSVIISAGTISVSQDGTLSSGNIVTGGSNVTLARYTFRAFGEDVKISSLKVASTDQLDNVALYANGVQIGSTQTIAATGTVASATTTDSYSKLYNLGSSLVVSAGQTVTVEVRGDAKYLGTNATTTNNTIQVGLLGDLNNAQGMSSSQLLTVPEAVQTGPTMTVVGAGLTAAVNTAVTSISAVPNTTAQRIGSFVLQANSNEAVQITSMSVGVTPTTFTTTNLSSLYVTVDGISSTPVSVQTSNNVPVSMFQIPANSSKIVDVYANIGSATGSVVTSLLVNGYGVASNISVTGTVSSGQTATVGSGALANPTVKTGSGYTPDAQFVTGDTTQVIAYFNATSSNGTSVITEITFAATGTGSASAITEVTVGGKTSPVVSGVATVSGLAISVPVGYAGTNIPVTVKYNTVGQNGIASGLTAGVRITGLKYTSGNTEATKTSLTVESNLMTVVGSKPTLAIANPSDNTVGAGGSVIVARVTVSADAKGPVTVTTLPLSMQAAGAGSSAGTLTVKVGGSTVSISENMGAVGTTTAATGTITFTGGYEVAAGASVTFDIWDTVTFTSSDDSLRTSLGSNTLFTWTDVNGNAAGLTGASIYNYPTNTALLAY